MSNLCYTLSMEGIIMRDVNLLINNGVNVKKSLELFGDMSTYDDTLGDFLQDINEKETKIKQTKETLESTPENRTDIIEECKLRIAVYEEFAPKMMDETEIKTVIAEVLASLEITTPTNKDKGRIMKNLMPKVKGKADTKLVNQILSSMIS